MRHFDLLVFDWDGTLVDSIGSIVACTRRALEAAGAEGARVEAIRSTIGLGIREMMEAIVPGCDDALFERICVAYRQLWFSGYGARHRPFDGVDRFLQQLSAAGYLLAVATAKSRRGLEADFDRTGLGRHFVASRTVDEAPPKPHPAMLESLMAELGTTPDRSLMIGDTAHDLEMAAGAGVPGVGVLSGSHDRPRLSAAAPEAIFDSVLELTGWLPRGEGTGSGDRDQRWAP